MQTYQKSRLKGTSLLCDKLKTGALVVQIGKFLGV